MRIYVLAQAAIILGSGFIVYHKTGDLWWTVLVIIALLK